MKNSGLYLTIALIIIITGVGVGTYMTLENNYNKQTKVEEKEIKQAPNKSEELKLVATFHGGSSELTYETEIYKIDNGHDNYGFKYKSYEVTTTSWGSSKSNRKLIDEGEFMWTDGAFDVAQRNHAYSYVIEPGNDKTYSIEDFQARFIMD